MTEVDADSDEETREANEVEAGSGSMAGKAVQEEEEEKQKKELDLDTYDGSSKIQFPQAESKVMGGEISRYSEKQENDIIAEITNFVKAAHVTYTIKGFDRQGEFEVLRRYSEFHSFHAALSSRFPGLYIPSIPPKKAVGNTDVNFVIERRYFLDRFLSLLCEIDYLAWSEEFKLFLRHSFEYDKVSTAHGRPWPLCLKYRMSTWSTSTDLSSICKSCRRTRCPGAPTRSATSLLLLKRARDFYKR